MTLTVPSTIEQVFRAPAHRFKQGRRTVFTFALTLPELDGLLPQRVDEDVVKDANRRLTLSHAKQIEQYLRTHEDWVLGAILLGIEPDAAQFTPFPDSDGNPSASLGMLEIPYNRIGALRLFDGQHRRRAIQDVLAGLRDKEKERGRLLNDAKRGEVDPGVTAKLKEQLVEARAKRELLETQAAPIVLYLEGDIQALRLMFADAAKTKPIDAVTRARFDDRDPFNRAAVEVAQQSELLRSRIDMERNTVARTSPNLLSFNQLATILKTLMFGYYGRVSRVRTLELEADHEQAVKLGLDWADDFLPSSCNVYQDLLGHDADDSAVPSLRRETYALNGTVLRVLAACFHGWKAEMGDDLQPLAEFVRSESFDKSLAESLLVRAGLVPVGSTSPVARRQEVQKTIRYILRNAKNNATRKAV